jgi:hypothetical protein
MRISEFASTWLVSASLLSIMASADFALLEFSSTLMCQSFSIKSAFLVCSIERRVETDVQEGTPHPSLPIFPAPDPVCASY